MSDEKSKQGLLTSLRAGRADLEAAIAGLSEEHMDTPGVETNWSVKDVIAHLLFWERRALFYVEAARSGYHKDANIWEKGTIDALNARNYAEHRNRPVRAVLGEEHDIYEKLVGLIEALPESDLLDAHRFDWTRGEALYEELAGETFGHIHDHIEALRLWRTKMLSH